MNSFLKLASTLAVAQISSATLAQQNQSTSPSEESVPLWKGLVWGMSPENAAETLRRIDGVKTVEIIRRPKKPVALKTLYSMPDGVDIGVFRVQIQAAFIGDKLSEIALQNDSCGSAAVEADRIVSAALKDKFDHSGREKVVDDNGVLLEYRYVFWNDKTRVTMSFESSTPGASPQHGYMSGRVGSALSGLANSMADEAADAARKACPADANGARLKTSITYSAQKVFVDEQDARSAGEAAKSQRAKDSL
jgi:hypothetical protein